MDFNTIALCSLAFASPLIILTTAGVLNTKAGIANFGFDGIMCLGASIYSLIVSNWKSDIGAGVVFLAFLVAFTAGMIMSLLFSFLTITCAADQLMTSMILNFLCYGLAVVLPLAFNGMLNFSAAQVGLIANQTLVIILTLVLVYVFATIFLLTRLGLYIKALGQNTLASSLNYIKVKKSRYLISLFTCALVCLSGALLVYVQPSLFIVNNNFSGLGYIVIALWLASKSRFILSSLYALGFAFLYQITLSVQTVETVINTIPRWFLAMIPYIATLLFLMIFRLDTRLPHSWAVPYIKNVKK